MIESGEEINAILWIIVAIVALIPVSMFLVSYKRIKSKKLLLTTFAFTLFFIKALLLAMKIFIQNYNDETWWSVVAIIDIAIIGLIAYSLSKKA